MSVGITEDEFKFLLTPTVDQQLMAFFHAIEEALEETDRVAHRCFKAGFQFPQEWIHYTHCLRQLMSSTSVQPLPEKPSYPEGT